MRKLFENKKRVLVSIIAIAVVVVVLINICASALFSFFILKKDGWDKFEEYSYGEQLKNSSEWVSERSEEIQVENSEGKKLTALKIENEHVSHSYMVVCHQYGGSPYSMEEYAKHFYDLGFNIILPYMRGHGESPYNKISFGWQDSSDVTEWIEYITDKDPNARIALFGVSLGANAVTLSVSEELSPNVRFVIADSCYTSVDELMKEYIRKETHFSTIIVANLASVFAKTKVGETFENADTITKVKNIELPIMFINGENDTVVPPLVSKKLYENCEAYGVEEVIIENGTHGKNLEADKETYWANIDVFILNNIGI